MKEAALVPRTEAAGASRGGELILFNEPAVAVARSGRQLPPSS